MKIIPPAFAFNKLKKLTIPDCVVKICDHAFSDNSIEQLKLPNSIRYLSGFNNNYLKQINIPRSVATLGKKAFARNRIRHVEVPSNVRVIGEAAFWNTWHDTFLESAVIREGVEEIHRYAFSGNRLGAIELPKSLQLIDKRSFHNNFSSDLDLLEGDFLKLVGNVAPVVVSEPLLKDKLLKLLPDHTFVVDKLGKASKVDLSWDLKKHPTYISSDTVIKGSFSLSCDRSTKVYPVECSLVFKEITKPCKDIAWTASDFTYKGLSLLGFSKKGYLKLSETRSVSIPSTNNFGMEISNISENAFRGCGIKDLSFQGKFKELHIGESSFRDNAIESICFAEGIVSIDTYAFFQNKLVEVSFPSSLKKVGNHAFAKNNIYSLSFSERSSALSLDGFSFYGNNIYAVDLPSSIQKIHRDAFKGNNCVHIFTSAIDHSNRNAWFTHSSHHRVIETKGL